MTGDSNHNNRIIRDAFHDEFLRHPRTGLIQEFAADNTKDAYTKWVFVEGGSDVPFYANPNNSEFLTSTKFYRNCNVDKNSNDNEQIEAGGKEAVINAAKSICADAALRRYFANCFFIIDRDYNIGNDALISEDIKQQVYITQGHSAENYCMTEDNIRRIFAYVGMQPDEIQEFYNSLDAFLRRYMNYFALKATIAISYSTLLHRRNCPKEKISAVFLYDFTNNKLVDTTKMHSEMTRMNACVAENHLTELYQKILNNIGPRQRHESDELRQSRRMYLRGHNVFDYLFYYIENRARQTGKHIDRNTMAKMCAVEFDKP